MRKINYSLINKIFNKPLLNNLSENARFSCLFEKKGTIYLASVNQECALTIEEFIITQEGICEKVNKCITSKSSYVEILIRNLSLLEEEEGFGTVGLVAWEKNEGNYKDVRVAPSRFDADVDIQLMGKVRMSQDERQRIYGQIVNYIKSKG